MTSASLPRKELKQIKTLLYNYREDLLESAETCKARGSRDSAALCFWEYRRAVHACIAIESALKAKRVKP